MRDMGKFRGIRLDNGEWAEGDLLQVKRRGKPTLMFIMEQTPNATNYQVDPATVGEYVKTIHGNQVFTGDQARDKVSGFIYTLEYIEEYMRYGWTRPGTVFALIPDNRLELTGKTIHDTESEAHHG
jgi:hypothetical protein